MDKRGHVRLLQIFIKPSTPSVGLNSRLSRSGSLASLSALALEDPLQQAIREAAYSLQTCYEHCAEIPGILQATVIDLPEVVLVERPFLPLSLTAAIKNGLLPCERQWIAEQLVETVRLLHAKGQYHGDLRPANLLLTSYGRVFLTDLAPFKPYRMVQDDNCLFEYFYNEGGSEKSYMAPERMVPHCHDDQDGCQWAQGSVSQWQQADLYGLGLVMQELLSTPQPELMAPCGERRLPPQKPFSCPLPLYQNQPDVDEGDWQATLKILASGFSVPWIAMQMVLSASLRPEIDPMGTIELMDRFRADVPAEILNGRLIPHLIRLTDHQWTPVRLAALQLIAKVAESADQRCIEAFLLPSLSLLTQSGVMAVRLATVHALLALCKPDHGALLTRLVTEWLLSESAEPVKSAVVSKLLPRVAIRCNAAELVPRATAWLNEPAYRQHAMTALKLIAEAGIMAEEIQVILGGIRRVESVDPAPTVIPQIPVTAKDLGAVPIASVKVKQATNSKRPPKVNQGWVPRGVPVGRFGSLVTTVEVADLNFLITGHSDGTISLWSLARLGVEDVALFSYRLEHGSIISVSGSFQDDHLTVFAVSKRAISNISLSMAAPLTVNRVEVSVRETEHDIFDARPACTIFTNGLIEAAAWKAKLPGKPVKVIWNEASLLVWDSKDLHLLDLRFGLLCQSWPFAQCPFAVAQGPSVFAVASNGVELYELCNLTAPIARYECHVDCHDLTLSWPNAPWSAFVGSDGQVRLWSGYRQDMGSLARSCVLGKRSRVRMEVKTIPVSIEEPSHTKVIPFGRYQLKLIHTPEASFVLVVDPLGHVSIFL